MLKRATAARQPNEVCNGCGIRYGTEFRDGYHTYWKGQCGVCHTKGDVTDPRNFGYMNNDWKKHARV